MAKSRPLSKAALHRAKVDDALVDVKQLVEHHGLPVVQAAVNRLKKHAANQQAAARLKAKAAELEREADQLLTKGGRR